MLEAKTHTMHYEVIMNEVELYKALLMVATYRAGGQVVATPEEFDKIKEETEGLRIGVVDGNKMLVRVIPK